MNDPEGQLLTLIIASAVVGGVVGAVLGHLFRRQAFLGGMLGAFLGFIGWALVFVIPDNRHKCPKCLAAIPSGASKCQHCGSNLS